MSAGPLRGYTGFQSRSAEFYELQPGVPEVSRDRKFGTLRQEACETDRITMGPQAGSFVCPKAEQASETMRQTMSVSANDYHPPKKSESKKRLPMDKPFLHDTTQRSFMIDAKKEQKELSQVTDSRMQQAFEIIDEDNTGTIDPIELRPVLFELFGHEPTEHEYRTFDAHCERNDLGVIDFDTWMKGAREALSHLYAETQLATSKPKQPWEKTKRREREVLGDPRRISTFSADFGLYGEDPRQRPIMDETGKTLNSTTKDLLEGSTKRSYQTPGYTGYIPHAANTKAYEIGRGTQPRDTFMMKTNLKDTFTRRLPGFTGHVEDQTDMESLDVQKPHGYFAPTEQQAADSLVENYWKAQNKSIAKNR
eukprot:gb/GECG01014263.1/.p1 GENE.gb/GECG01014263.1/~~gb/GECG01014263.1/.p1  ORF type:complete len:366 (+),score=43.10 gb/GECG01014263.1/:1-1098(+)